MALMSLEGMEVTDNSSEVGDVHCQATGIREQVRLRYICQFGH